MTASTSTHRTTISDYFSLIKFSHTVFALPFALVGFFLAVWHNGYPFEWRLLLLVVLCMVFARTSAMAFNRYSDRKLDARNERTRKREIPSGRIRAGAALALSLSAAAMFVLTTWFINPLCFYLSPVALAIILGYSYTKRFTAWSHFVLGLGLSLAPVGAYLAVAGVFSALPIMLAAAVLFWVAGFDIIYALQDTEFDREQRLKSVPALAGNTGALVLSSLMHGLTAAALVAAGILGGFGYLYWMGAGAFVFMLIYQHTLVKPRDLRRVNAAFFTANGIASVIFAAFAIADLWRSYDGSGISN